VHFPVDRSANVPSGQVSTQELSDFNKNPSLQTTQPVAAVHFEQLAAQLEVQSLPNFPAGQSFTQVWYVTAAPAIVLLPATLLNPEAQVRHNEGSDA
jgi:hypothetical protein